MFCNAGLLKESSSQISCDAKADTSRSIEVLGGVIALQKLTCMLKKLKVLCLYSNQHVINQDNRHMFSSFCHRFVDSTIMSC